jgi:hypothetical protein
MIQVLAAIGGGTTVVLIGLSAWLIYKLVAAQRETMIARDLLHGARSISAEWEHKHVTVTAELGVTKKRLEQEQTLRAIVERRCEVAQDRVRELLRKYVAKATNEEIQELTNEAFTTPLAVVPRAPDGVPQVPRSQSARDGLIDPWADVQPAKPPA